MQRAAPRLRLLPAAFGIASCVRHAGHSKWHNTRFRKAKQDAVKNAAATRFSAAIRAAVATGNELAVEDAVDRAKQAGVTKDVIERALDRSRQRGSLTEVLYEGTLSGGIIVIAEALTDNPRRTAPQVRHILKEAGGSLGASGSSSWAFERRGRLVYAGVAGDSFLEAALDAGAEDVVEEADEDADAGVLESNTAVYCAPSDLAGVRAALHSCGFQAREESLIYVPTGALVEPVDEEAREHIENTLDTLEELEDVEDVWHNLAPAASCQEDGEQSS
eukprot:scaffold176053_cov33-Tisochrysis_lutea.AAC.1